MSEESANVDVKKSRSISTTMLWVCGIGMAFALAAVSWIALPGVISPKVDVVEVAGQWVDLNTDPLSQEITVYITGSSWDAASKGDAWIKTKVKESVSWSYRSLGEVGDGVYHVQVIGRAKFDVEGEAGSGEIDAWLPFLLNIDYNAQSVESWDADLISASFLSTIPTSDVGELVLDCVELAESSGFSEDELGALRKPAAQRTEAEKSMAQDAVAGANLAAECAVMFN